MKVWVRKEAKANKELLKKGGPERGQAPPDIWNNENKCVYSTNPGSRGASAVFDAVLGPPCPPGKSMIFHRK